MNTLKFKTAKKVQWGKSDEIDNKLQQVEEEVTENSENLSDITDDEDFVSSMINK